MRLSVRSHQCRGISRWPALIFVLIGLNMCVVGITVYFAHSDGSFSIEPNYYQKAVAWNETARQRQINANLGWIASLTTDATTGADAESRALTLAIVDRDGKPVAGALIMTQAFSSSRAAQRQQLAWSEARPGVYRTTLDKFRPGVWEFRVIARRGDVMFTTSIEQKLDAPDGGTQ